MRIAIIGTGYVGLVAGACFADSGNDVICVDRDPNKIDALSRGEIPIYEPGLESLVERSLKEGRITFTTSTAEAVLASEVIFLAVGTPSLSTGEPNLTYLRAAAEEVARSMDGYRIVVNKSTVPIGSHRVVADWMRAVTKHPFDVASNPEFLKEGTAVSDFLKPDRVIIGTESQEVYAKMAELYAPFVRQGNPILWMDPISAEITKYACNSFLATRISFMNELAVLCEKVGGDIDEIRRGMSTDERIGRHFLYAGVGYGGSCFPKDIQALLATARKEGVPMGIVAAADTANERQKRHLVNRIKSHYGSQLDGKTFAVWGLAFKPNTDDMREAPSLTIIQELLGAGAKIQAFDPVATESARKVLEDKITYCETSYDALKGADALVLVTEWNEFRHPDFDRMRKLLKKSVIFDGRNLYSPQQMEKERFSYFSIGKDPVIPES